MIPRTISQSWKTKDLEKISVNMLSAMNSIKNMNPEYTYQLYDDDDCRQFILENFGKAYADAFDDLIPGAFKCDLWRYAKLYVDGGVYLDIDFTELVPLKDIIQNDDEFVSATDVKASFRPPCAIFNAFIACRPKHPIMLEALRLSFYNIINHKTVSFTTDLDITGPVVLGRAMNLYWNKMSLENIVPGLYKDTIGNIRLLEYSNGLVTDFKNNVLFTAKYVGYETEMKESEVYGKIKNYYKTTGKAWKKEESQLEKYTASGKRSFCYSSWVSFIFFIIILYYCIYKYYKSTK
jgi:mannosyltransferase OCH1-like enzyme